MWLWSRKLPWSLWKHNSSTGDWQALTHTALSPVFRLSGFLLTETLSVSLGGRGSSYTFPPGGWSLSDPVRISQRFLKEVWVERCGVPVWKWLCNPKFPGAVLLFKADGQKKIMKPWLDPSAREVSFVWMLWQLYTSTGGWQASSDHYLWVLNFEFHPWEFHLSLVQRFNRLNRVRASPLNYRGRFNMDLCWGSTGHVFGVPLFFVFKVPVYLRWEVLPIVCLLSGLKLPGWTRHFDLPGSSLRKKASWQRSG